MTKTVKTSECMDIYAMLKDAKLGRVNDEDKFKVFRLLRKLKVVAQAYNDVKDDALDSFKGENHDGIVADLRKWQEEEKHGRTITLSKERREEVVAYLNRYNGNVDKAITAELSKEQELEFDALTEDAVDALAMGNDWTFAQTDYLAGLICE